MGALRIELGRVTAHDGETSWWRLRSEKRGSVRSGLRRPAEKQCVDLVRRVRLHRRPASRHLARLEQAVGPVHRARGRHAGRARSARARTTENLGDRVPDRRCDARWVEHAALELLVVAADLGRESGGACTPRDRVDDSSTRSAFATRARSIGGSSSVRTNSSASWEGDAGARAQERLDYGASSSARSPACARMPSTSSGLPRACRRASSSSKVSIRRHASSHSRNRACSGGPPGTRRSGSCRPALRSPLAPGRPGSTARRPRRRREAVSRRTARVTRRSST